MTRFSVNQFLTCCVPSGPDDEAVFDTVTEAREHMVTVALDAVDEDPDDERQLVMVLDNGVQVAWGPKCQAW
jgi:hypothetical protein